MLPGILCLLAVFSGGIGVYLLSLADVVFAGVAFICGAVFFSSAAIMHGLEKVAYLLEKMRNH